MPSLVRKTLLVVGAALIAAAITGFPWLLLARTTGEISSLFGMTAILWAPLALIVGIFAGILFAFLFWPRRLSAG